MLRRLILWTIAALTGGLLLLLYRPDWQQKIAAHRWFPDQYAYGDLYNLTSLPDFKETNFRVNTLIPNAEKPARKVPNVNLYVIGDSFSDIDTSFYAAAHTDHVWIGGVPDTIRPANGRKQILVIECIERTIQERMYAPALRDVYVDGGMIPASRAQHPKPTVKAAPMPWYQFRFSTQADARLEFLLFNFRPFTWLKEQKARLNQAIFGRATGAQVFGKALVYNIEALPESYQSSFWPVSQSRLDTLVTNLNWLRRYYLRQGMDEVYFSFIPNKTTVFQYHRPDYNHQIERIEAHSGLQVPLLTTIDTLRRHPDWYHLGDGHWNRQGKRYWVGKVNKLIADWGRGQPPTERVIR